MLRRISFSVPKPLETSIQCYWSGEFYPENEPLQQEVLPSPYLELIFHLSSASCLLKAENEFKESSQSLFIGLQKNIYAVAFNQKVQTFAIRLSISGLHTFFNISASELINSSGNLEDLTQDIKTLSEQILEAKDSEERVNFCNRFFIDRLKSVKKKNRFEQALEYVYKENNSLNLEMLSNIACLSERQFERLFKKETGHSLSSFQQMQRSVKVANAIQSNGKALTEIAHQFNYADQAHMSRTYTKWSGMNPKAFRQFANRFLVNC